MLAAHQQLSARPKNGHTGSRTLLKRSVEVWLGMSSDLVLGTLL